jgi:hypothetical protein
VQRRPALEQISAVLEPLLRSHGFSYDERTNAGADPDRPWLLFHADPPDRFVEVHPGCAAHLFSADEDQHDRVEVWLPIAVRELADWFATVDERFPLD